MTEKEQAGEEWLNADKTDYLAVDQEHLNFEIQQVIQGILSGIFEDSGKAVVKIATI